MSGQQFLAFDLGAESGRAILGRLEDGRLSLIEAHRFPNDPVLLPDGLHWDALRLQHELLAGLCKAARMAGGDFTGIGVDTWGVDFGLLGKGGVLLGNPYHYRDPRTDGMLGRAFKIVPKDDIYKATGIQFMSINTLYQLLYMVQNDSPLLSAAETLLFMPGLFNFFLTGARFDDSSIASTSQCWNVAKNGWARAMLNRFGLPAQLFPRIFPPGTIVGPLRAAITEASGARGTVIATASHDTAAAVAAVPAEGKDFMYISSGTWSLAGLETEAPVINERSLAAGLTNEGGVCGTVRLLKNVMGLWLVQECRRAFARAGHEYNYAELTALAAEAEPFRTLIDPDDGSFLHPEDMPAAIAAFAARTDQKAPDTPGAFVRTALESLALKYRLVLETLREATGRDVAVVHMVGGGIKNELLCRMTADATGLPVVAGPVEATAIGNILVQAMALGGLEGLAGLRAVVRASFAPQTYKPREREPWQEAYGRFLALRP